MLLNLFLKGIHSKIESIDAKRIYFVNVLSLLCLFTSIAIVIPYIILNMHLLAGVCIVFSAGYVMSFNFNCRGQYSLAKAFLFSTIAINIFALSLIFGSKINMTVFYIPLIVILFLLFDKEHKAAFAISVVVVIAMCVLGFVMNNFAISAVMILEESEIFIINSMFSGISLFGTFFVCYVFIFSSELVLKGLAKKNERLLQERNEQEDLNELNNKLLSIISHDVRQPVNNLLSLSEIMLQAKISEEEIQQLGMRLKETSIYVYQMLDNLLTWSYSQMNSLHPEPITLLLADEVNQELKNLAYLVEQKKIRIELHINPHTSIKFDKMMFLIVFRNIITNAIKFSQAEGCIRIYASKTEADITLSICDEGIGIPEDIIGKLFANNFSKNRFGTHNEKGAGIGLMLCKQLMDANQSYIRAKENPGRGATFMLIFPDAI